MLTTEHSYYCYYAGVSFTLLVIQLNLFLSLFTCVTQLTDTRHTSKQSMLLGPA